MLEVNEALKNRISRATIEVLKSEGLKCYEVKFRRGKNGATCCWDRKEIIYGEGAIAYCNDNGTWARRSLIPNWVLEYPIWKLAKLIIHECSHAVMHKHNRKPLKRGHGKRFREIELKLFEKYFWRVVEVLS